MTTIAYIRISTSTQDMAGQKLAIHEYAHKNNLTIDEFVEVQQSSKKDMGSRKVERLLELKSGDLVIVSEMSRLGRSVGEVVTTIDTFVSKGIHFISIKENIIIKERQDIQTKAMITMFSLFSEMERDLISIRTKEALAALKAQGKHVGRPKGSLGKSKLEGRKDEIKKLMGLKVNQAAISKIMGVNRKTLKSFVDSRRL